MSAVDDLRALGYEVGIASGCVKTEEDALAAAVALADPGRIQDDVQVIATQAAIDAAELAAQRGIPQSKIPSTVTQVVENITRQALEHITTARTETVAFHERALANAKAMPTTYVATSERFGIHNMYFNIDDATGEPDEDHVDIVDSLRDPARHQNRCFQVCCDGLGNGEEIRGAVHELRLKGWTVAASIEEDGTGLQAEITAEGETGRSVDTLAKLRAAADQLPDLTPEEV